MDHQVLTILIFNILFGVTLFGQSNWIALGNPNAFVEAILFDEESGDCYIGGRFKYIEEVECNGVAVMRNSEFTDLATGYDFCINSCPNSFRDIIKFEDDFYFTHAGGEIGGGVPFKGFVKWDGLQWESVGNGITTLNGNGGVVFDQEVYNGDLIFAGIFNVIDTVRANSIGGFDGENFYSLDFPFNDNPNSPAIIVDVLARGDSLFVCGNFRDSLDFAHDVAMYHDGVWTPVGNGISGLGDDVLAMQFYRDELYIGGGFSENAGNAGNGVMKLQDNRWVNVSGGFGSSSSKVNVLEVHNDELYAFGIFYTVGENNITASNIAKWDGESWSGNLDEIDGEIFTSAFANDTLIIGGRFRNISGENIQHLARISVDEINFLTTNVDDMDTRSQNVVVYPNPVTDEINVRFDGYRLNSPVNDIHLVSILGGVVPVGAFRRNDNGLQINTSSIKPGAYVLSFSQDGKRYFAKFFKN